jgi:ribose transport system permease protein
MATRLRAFEPRYAAAPLSVILVWLIFGAVNPFFLSIDNGLNIAGQFGALAIVALGEMIVIVTGGFDISVGSVAALSTVVGALAINALGIWGIVVLPLTGIVAGLLNGLTVSYLRVQPIITTLGMLLFARGLALYLSGGDQTVSIESSDILSMIGYGDVAGVPSITVIVLIMGVCVALLLAKLRLGRRLYMVGSNPQSSALVGVSVEATVTAAYALCGLSAGIAGIVFLSRAGGGLPTEGNGLELQAIAAAVIGGAALSGGIGAAAPILFSAFFIQSLLNGLNLRGTSPFVAEILLGMVIIFAGFLDFIIRRYGTSRRGETL